MEINIIGSGSIGATDMSASTLIDKKILIDVPNGIVKHIKKLGYNTGEIESILITHLHGDHFFDIPFFMFDRYFQKNDNLVCIYCPKGTKEKVQLILVMSRRAKLYCLDEPIAGVDPAARDYILSTIINNYEPDSTILISTHLISDVENILDEVVFIKNGHIVLKNDVEDIRFNQGKSVDVLFREVFKC